ncbi:MAG: photosystem II protein Psb27 [Cyanobacteria bacterium CRU_2_1]|nr:photosystem II protein Psb27 [Cyanobacteria bacterium RU_5_0]NJR58752.1 photosystem II protein Psb27 [Cyanobacteria bacterium CRU_2_1]
MKRFLSRLLALTLVLVIGLMGCSASPTGLSGNYRQDTLTLIEGLRTALSIPDSAPDKPEAQSMARQQINDFVSRYRRDGSLVKLGSFTTMRTALNSLAGHYSSYPNRPVPQKLKDRLELEFKQVESALRREA